MTALASYHDLIARKRVAFTARGFAPPELHQSLKDHQRECVRFALAAGCSAMFLDTGLGKTFAALEWGRAVVEHTNKPVIMLAPLAVAQQHQREAERFGIDAVAVRDGSAVDKPRVYITNYDRLARFDADRFGGVILDESSILKSLTGATRKRLTSAFVRTPYRLCCTATPAPNDHSELGGHAEFLGVMRREEMLPLWFIHDSADTGTWRLKGHAVEPFWSWVASWARCVSRPSDLGFSDDGFVLPELIEHRHTVTADRDGHAFAKDGQGGLFRMPDTSATSIHTEKRLTAEKRADVVAALVAREPGEAWVVWCDSDYEADALAARMPEAVEVRGSMSPDAKEAGLEAFSRGQARVIISKPSLAGFGLNWQHCARMAFIGLSFSYESYYQAIRRCWRYGQTRPVHVHVACADTEAAIHAVVDRKAGDHAAMKDAMRAAMVRASRSEQARKSYLPEQKAMLPAWMTG